MPRKKISKNSYNLLADMTAGGSKYTAKNNLYAWYQFDSDPTATIIDKSGNSRNLTPGASPSISSDIIEHKTSGFPKSSFSFNSSDLVRGDVGNSFTFNEPGFSGAAWIKIPDYSTNHFIMSKFKDPTDPGGTNWEWIFQIPGTGKLSLTLYQNATATRSTSSAQDVPINEWLHVGFVYNGLTGITSLYINGKNVSVTTNNSGTFGQVQDTNAKFVVGWNDGQYHSFDTIGNIAEVALWNEKLTDSDFSALYKIIAPSKMSGFVNLPPRIEIRNRDNATGSYPTILRMGDKDRRGSYSTQFDDTNTIFFGRRIRDNFELKDEDKVDGVLGVSKNINSKLWVWSKGLEIRRELFRTAGADSTSRDGALVFVGGPRGASGRFLRTKNKIKNATLQAEIIFGPYNESRTALGYGLGLKSPGGLEDRGLKIQVSTTGAVGTWITIKTLTGNADSLFLLSTADSREEFETLLRKRKRVKIKLSPTDFASVGSSEFYLRFAQTSVINRNRAEWAIGYVNIEYHNEDVRYPIMVDPTSRVGQRVISGAVATPHTLPTITAPGRSISGISDVHLKFTPGEGISAFDESRINIKSEDFFFQQGSDPDVISGMSAPLWSKTQFVIDLSPNEETTFGMTTRHPSGGPTLDDTIKQQLMVYWNNKLKRWEKIAQGISSNQAGGTVETLNNMISSGALGFGCIDAVSTGDSNTLESQSTYSANVLNGYARPTSTFGFPFEGKYHATSSQLIKAKDIGINKPFILEKCQISFESKFEFPKGDTDGADQGRNAYSVHYAYGANSSDNDDNFKVIIPTFFIARQQNFDSFEKHITYTTQDRGDAPVENTRFVKIPNYAYLSNVYNTASYIDTSRELITYGQMTLFASSSFATRYVNSREVLDAGLSRDLEVDILELSGQSSWNNQVALTPITSSFTINFPSRVTGKIEAGGRILVDNGTDSSIWLDNSIGGRSYGNLDSSARAIINGTPALSPGGEFEAPAIAGSGNNYLVKVSTADSIDKYSPYIIFPEDEIIFGWQYPAPRGLYSREPRNSDERLNSMTLFGGSKLVLFGSQLQDEREFHETVNQNLGSAAIHEVIGSEPVVDKFEVSRAIENKGNYLDNFVAVTSENPVTRLSARVQSRLTTPKGQNGAAVGSITIGQLAAGLPIGGIDDGDLIILQDHLGNYGFFFFFEDSPYAPQGGSWGTAGGVTVYDWDDDGGGGSASSWSGNYQDITGNVIDYNQLAGVGGSINWKSKFNTIDSDIIAWLIANDALAGAWAGSTVYKLPSKDVFSVNTFSEASSISGAKNTLDRFRLAIKASSLDIVPDDITEIYNPGGGGAPVFVYYSWYARLGLTQGAGGTSGNKVIYVAHSDSIDGSANSYGGFARSSFSGGAELLDSTLGSFTRVIPTGDGNRVYSDSLIKRADIGARDSSYGTMQAFGRGIRPKYYLDGKKYGQSIHFLEQAKDSKTKFSLKTKKFGLLDTVKVGALQSPVSITFVSGTNSSSTGFRTFSKKSPTDAINKSVNSVLTGAFYDPT